MNKLNELSTEIYEYNEMYRVDVTTNPDLNTREAYLYHKMGCIKMLILEMHIDEYTLEEFMGFVEADIESDEYIKKYEEKYRRH